LEASAHRSEDDGTNALSHRALLILEFVDRSRCPIGFTTVAADFGQWPGFESEPSSLERLIPDHPLTGKKRIRSIRLVDGESSRDQFDPTDRAGGTTGLEPVMPGMAGVVGLPSRAGAPGN
jgi:hypothetical protein